MAAETTSNSERSGQRYAELLCDFMFKRLFGSEANKDVLIDFLNMVLSDVTIVDVEFIPTEHLGLTEHNSKAVFDISCRCSDGTHLIIEMQKGNQKHFRERALFYTSYPINEQGRQAKEVFIRDHECLDDGEKFRWDFNLSPVMVIAILNFRFEHDSSWPSDLYTSSYRLREDGTHELMTDVLRFVFIELGRFKKRIWELETVLDKWLYLFKHIHELTSIPDEFQTPTFRRLFLLSEIGNFAPEEYEQYLLSMGEISDYYNTIDTAAEEAEKRGHARGLKEGTEKGRKEGREEGKRAAIRTMLAAGVTVEEIAKAFSMTEEECRDL